MYAHRFILYQKNFNQEFFLRLLACHIAVGNKPLSLVDDWDLQQLLLYMNPAADIPSRYEIRKLIMNEFKAEAVKIKPFFQSQLDLKV